ncbi:MULTISPECIES: MFS transporter [Arthrobacter]|uniref:MFS transporter n=1 Tax=Arthrobacter terricola TaxID=2547396 RepID=A0A4V2ZRY9_9MICC|nr:MULTISPECIES: MFS transporter [Arthrobacter]MBT8163268.1 MFS transporter [Arthrobacter sp. GN70]TDF91184.1 MFS transporter [Arthrobacter terricola]
MTSQKTTIPTVTQARGSTRKINKRHAMALGGGMALEWFDFTVYGLMAALLAPHFFPGNDPVASTLSALMVFAVGFIARPLAGIFVGPIADRAGHKKILVISIAAISGSSLLMGLLPTYSQIGVWAAVALVCARLIQGLSTGIEQAVGNSAAVEMATPGHEGRFTTIVSGSILQAGIMLASLVSFIVSASIGGAAMAEWGWRIPFLVGGIAGIFVIYLRRSLPETGAANHEGDTPPSTADVWKQVWKSRGGFLAILFVVAGTQTANYAWTVGLPGLARAAYNEDPTHIFAVTTMLGILMIVAGTYVGALCDKYGNLKVFTIIRFTLIPAVFLITLYNERNILAFATVMLIGGIAVALNQTLFNFIISTLMPAGCRTTGMAVAYGLGVAIFGGTSSYILVWAQQQNMLWAFSSYAAALSIISIWLYSLAARKGQVHIGN